MQSNQRLSIVLISLALAVLPACDVAVVDKEENPTPPAIEPVSTSFDPSEENSNTQNPDEKTLYRIEATTEPNQYAIVFRSDIRARLLSKAPENLGYGIYEGGKTYEFEIQEPGNTDSAQIEIPQDIVVNESITAPDAAEWVIATNGRIFLTRNALLTTLDKPLTLAGSEIISDSAQIQTFVANAQAPRAQSGRDGGSIKIVAQRASGTLSVFQRGEAGGNGAAGLPYLNRASEGQSHGGGYRWPGFFCPPIFHMGGIGAEGLKGLPGENGGRGGNAGDFEVQVPDTSNLTLTYEISPGVGGVAGIGGPGQEGGLGGRSGWMMNDPSGKDVQVDESDSSSFTVCIEPRGPNGMTGLPGDSGIAGNPGAKGKFCSFKDNQFKCE